MDDGLDAGQIKRNGWRQGSILGEGLVAQLASVEELPSYSEDGHWVVLSHDCDVTNRSLVAEPRVEVIFGRKISSDDKDGNRQWGKNSRLLQISNPPDVDSLEHLQFDVRQRFSFSRSEICNHKPSAQTLDAEIVSRLVAWITKRYVRAGFPDEFNERTRGAIKKIRKLSKKDGEYLTGLYLFVNDVELISDEDYELILIGSMRPQCFDDPVQRKLGTELLGGIESVLDDCEGISVSSAELRSESKISLTEIRYMKRWDFDDLTLRGEPQDAIPEIA